MLVMRKHSPYEQCSEAHATQKHSFDGITKLSQNYHYKGLHDLLVITVYVLKFMYQRNRDI